MQNTSDIYASAGARPRFARVSPAMKAEWSSNRHGDGAFALRQFAPLPIYPKAGFWRYRTTSATYLILT